MRTKIAYHALSVIAALGYGAIAYAAPAASPNSDPESMSVTVPVADLNLGSEAGAKVLLHRIRNAARDVCADAFNPSACRKDTIDRAIATLDSPTVTALNGWTRPRITRVANGQH